MRRPLAPFTCIALLAVLGLLTPHADGQPPRMRVHTVNQSSGLQLEQTKTRPPTSNQVTVSVQGTHRVIRSNGVPNHLVGSFPNRGNPHRIEVQNHVYRVPLRPQIAKTPTALGMHDWGVAVNGVPIDPGAAEFWRGDRNSGWQYEALGGAVALGIDANHAHVQPSGAYHYHGLPTGLLQNLGVTKGQHSPLVGWAADGFPVYALYGYSDPQDAASPIRAIRSSYRLREGKRPSEGGQPGGTFDGTFVQDYAYTPGSGDLDECSGRVTVTPEAPDGIYAYFLTADFPVVPRCYRGTPDSSFFRRPGRRPQRR